MLYETEGNLLFDNYDVICHQVNCRGVMGSGIARQIRQVYHEAYGLYLRRCKYYASMGTTESLLGRIDFTRSKGRFVVNMYAQDRYGRDKRYTDYAAFKSCLDLLKTSLSHLPETATVAFPYKIGCGLAGGDWDTVFEMIKEFSENIKQNVYIVHPSEN